MTAPRAARRRGEAGLAVLEWLLIVAAVAGLAALAVVLARQAADETAEGLAASSARLTAAMVAAARVEDDARAAASGGSWGRWESQFESRCRRLAITYADAGALVAAAFVRPVGAEDGDPVDPAALASAGEGAPDASTAQALCGVLAAAAARPRAPPPPAQALHDAQRAAADLEAEARVLRRGETWAQWKARFEPRCSQIAAAYPLIVRVRTAAFNGPTGQAGASVTQALLDAATPHAPGPGKPQLTCTVELAR
ncbi:MAG: hypothetical protein OXP08_09840 [bacterium]|nr:hypothetical protein [bacterium]